MIAVPQSLVYLYTHDMCPSAYASMQFGEELCVVGEADELGAWDVSRCVSMAWNEGDVWVAEAELPSGYGAAPATCC